MVDGDLEALPALRREPVVVHLGVQQDAQPVLLAQLDSRPGEKMNTHDDSKLRPRIFYYIQGWARKVVPRLRDSIWREISRNLGTTPLPSPVFPVLDGLGEVHHELVEGNVFEVGVEGDLRLDEGADRKEAGL